MVPELLIITGAIFGLLLAAVLAAARWLPRPALYLLSLGTILWLLLRATGLDLTRELVNVSLSRTAAELGRLVGLLLGVGLSAGLVFAAQDDRRPGSGRFPLLLAAGLGLAVGAAVFRQGLLVNATGRAAEDHLPAGWLLAAVAAGILLQWFLPGARRRMGLAYTLALPALILTAYFLAWQVDPQAITRERAGRIDEAIIRYAAERGSYPDSLSDLTPTYLPYFLRPVTGRDQVWCYEGGADYYRLGYVVYRRYDERTFPTPYVGVAIAAEAGIFPRGGWMCDEELRRVEITGGL